MRLYNTSSPAGSATSPSRRARSGCTSAARPSTRAPTSATRGRSCSAVVQALAARARLRGDARAQHHRRQRQDLRGGAGRERRARPTRRPSGTSRTPAASGSTRSTTGRRRPRRWTRSSRFIVDLIERGYAYEVEGDVYFRVARFAEYGRLSGQRLDQLEDEQETPNPLKEDPRDFALWKANKPGEDTCLGLALGRGRPGWHIECSAMAEKLLGPVVRDPRRRARPRLPPPRERARAVAGARARVREDLDAQRHAPLHRREDVEVARQRRDDPGGARPLGSSRRCCSSSSPRTGAARSTSPTRPWSRRGRSGRRFRRRSTSARRPRAASGWEDFEGRSTTTSTRRPRWPSCTSGGARATLELLQRALGLFGLRRPMRRRPGRDRRAGASAAGGRA